MDFQIIYESAIYCLAADHLNKAFPKGKILRLLCRIHFELLSWLVTVSSSPATQIFKQYAAVTVL